VQESGSFHTTQKSKKSDFLKKSDFSMVWILPLSCTRSFKENRAPLADLQKGNAVVVQSPMNNELECVLNWVGLTLMYPCFSLVF